MKGGRLGAMCLWSPAALCLLNQSSGCDRQPVRRGVFLRRSLLEWQMLSSVGRRSNQINVDRYAKVGNKHWIVNIKWIRKCIFWSHVKNKKKRESRGRMRPGILWLSQTGAVGLGCSWTLGFYIKEKRKKKKSQSKSLKKKKSNKLCQECTGKKQHIRFFPSDCLSVSPSSWEQ